MPFPKAVIGEAWRLYNFCYDSLEGRCFSCNKEISINSYHTAHVQAESKGGSNDIENARPTCLRCNDAGHCGTKNLFEWMKEVGNHRPPCLDESCIEEAFGNYYFCEKHNYRIKENNKYIHSLEGYKELLLRQREKNNLSSLFRDKIKNLSLEENKIREKCREEFEREREEERRNEEDTEERNIAIFGFDDDNYLEHLYPDVLYNREKLLFSSFTWKQSSITHGDKEWLKKENRRNISIKNGKYYCDYKDGKQLLMMKEVDIPLYKAIDEYYRNNTVSVKYLEGIKEYTDGITMKRYYAGGNTNDERKRTLGNGKAYFLPIEDGKINSSQKLKAREYWPDDGREYYVLLPYSASEKGCHITGKDNRERFSKLLSLLGIKFATIKPEGNKKVTKFIPLCEDNQGVLILNSDYALFPDQRKYA